MNDTELARRLADSAGRLLVTLRESKLFEGKALGKRGDELANTFIVQALRTHRPADGLLSEEEQDSAARLGLQRVWIVDPLDGTREYGEGRADWAVHVALAIDGAAALGAVALPGLPLTLASGDAVARPRHAGRLRIVVSRTRPAAEAVAVAEALGAELLPMGSAGAKIMSVVRGESDIYMHSGGQREWDSCAPVAVAQAAGLHVSRLDGRALRYNQANTHMPDLLVCPPELAERVIALAAQRQS
ncbi:MAG: 3'(2'),5'-bisphosphate nucleotidase CysQ [Gammaproteobacteria bacterium]|nr:3'(2'),5'-bisphosphate nucleotidase CysQ [Gammaproteobacteria bacterium]